jgi:hypothetical protein
MPAREVEFGYSDHQMQPRCIRTLEIVRLRLLMNIIVRKAAQQPPGICN